MTTTKNAETVTTMRLHVARVHARALDMPQESGWLDRHMTAWNTPLPGMEAATVNAIKAWLAYADAELLHLDYQIGDDDFAGPYWEQWGLALRGLLSMDTGKRLDCGTLDSIIWGALTLQGFGDAERAGR